MSYVAKIQAVTARLGTHVGESHECVAVVKALTGAPQTTQWKKGIWVRGANVKEGTAIATFDSRGKYKGHAAIYIKQDQNGILVYDQWTGRPLKERMIKFKGGVGYVSNDGDQFYVIE